MIDGEPAPPAVRRPSLAVLQLCLAKVLDEMHPQVVDQFMPLLLSVGGLAEFIFAIVAAIDDSEDVPTIIASLLTPLPTAFSFLTLPAIKDTEAGPP